MPKAKTSGAARPPAKSPGAHEVESQIPSKRRVGKPKIVVSRKSTTKAGKKTDKRGCPKGKGVTKGGPGKAGSGTKRKGKIGNPPYEPTLENRIRVEAMVAVGAQQWFIAEELGVSEDTLQLHHRRELDHGKDRVDARIGGSIVQRAVDGDTDLMKFYAARRMGWKTTTEVSGPAGGPLTVVIAGADAKL